MGMPSSDSAGFAAGACVPVAGGVCGGGVCWLAAAPIFNVIATIGTKTAARAVLICLWRATLRNWAESPEIHADFALRGNENGSSSVRLMESAVFLPQFGHR